MKRVEIGLPDETFAGLDRESAELATELRAAATAKCMKSQESMGEALTGARLLLQP
jgi:hypothetical protein